MSRFLKKYQTVDSFNEAEGEGDVVTSVAPGVAFVEENENVAYNEVPQPDEPDVTPEPVNPSDEPVARL